MCTPTQGVWQPAGCVSCEPVCVCVSLVRVVIICLASTHTALVSSPSLAVLHLPTYIHTYRRVLILNEVNSNRSGCSAGSVPGARGTDSRLPRDQFWKPAQARSLRSGRQRACDPWQGDSPPVGEPNSGGGSPLSPRRPSNRRVVCRRCAVGAPSAGDISASRHR